MKPPLLLIENLIVKAVHKIILGFMNRLLTSFFLIMALCQILLMKRLRRLFLGDVFWYLRILKQHNSADKLIVIAETVCHPLELFNFPNRALQSTI